MGLVRLPDGLGAIRDKKIVRCSRCRSQGVCNGDITSLRALRGLYRQSGRIVYFKRNFVGTTQAAGVGSGAGNAVPAAA